MAIKTKFPIDLSLVTDDTAHAVTVTPALSEIVNATLYNWETLTIEELKDTHLLLFDVDTTKLSNISRLKELQKQLPRELVTVIPVTKGNRKLLAQVNAIGVQHTVQKPMETDDLIKKIVDMCKTEPALKKLVGEEKSDTELAAENTLAMADLFDQVATAFRNGERLPADAINACCNDIIDTLRRMDMSIWLQEVRKHSSYTYRHMMMVTGYAASFGITFNMNMQDTFQLALGGMLHDVGKVKIPARILDKPSKLTAEEFELIRKHPVEGATMLMNDRQFDKEIVQIVRSHHEYLDGSGYPDGLRAENIPDPVRVMTVVDIFSALVETRSYKAAMPEEKAFKMLREMGGKVDQDIVSAFEPVAFGGKPKELLRRVADMVA